MRISGQNLALTAALVMALTGMTADAEDAPPRGKSPPKRGEPIVFSEARTDPAATNVTTEGSTQGIKDLDDDLRKPFDLFSLTPNIRPAFRPPPQTPQMIQKSKRSEEFLRNREDAFFDTTGTKDMLDEDPYGLDAKQDKLKTPLDRYYDRLDRERAALTNRFKSHDLFDNRKEEENADSFFGGLFRNGFKGSENELSSRGVRRSSNNAYGSGLFSTDPIRPRQLDESSDPTRTETAERARKLDDRLDAYRKLIGGDSFSAPQRDAGLQGTSFNRPESFNPLSRSTAPAAARSSPGSSPYAVSAPALYSPASAIPPSPSYSTVKSYGNLQSAQGFASTPSLSPTPIITPPEPAKAKKPATFELPRRHF